ncbi:MAG: polysaccharide biosynthesis protein [Armatimonadetes bacterium]|nr:polysaccharide biosynthesis protein [Armatimonadota bacterium]
MPFHHKVFLFLTDLALLLSSVLLALVIRFEGPPPLVWLEGRLWEVLLAALFTLVSLLCFGLYSKVWKYAGVEEVLSIFYAVTAGFLLFSIPVFYTGGIFYPRSVTIIAWLIAVLLVGGVRFLLKVVGLRTRRRPFEKQKRILIVGAGDPAEHVLREIRREDSGYFPVGLIDEDPARRGLRIHEVPVLGKPEDLPDLTAAWSIEEIIIPLAPSGSRSLMRRILSLCRSLPVKLKVVPSFSEVIDGRVQVGQIREVRIEDLLEREAVTVNLSQIASFIGGQRVLVTGAGGSIGAELCRQIVSFGPETLLLLGRGENSIYEIHLELAGRHRHCLLPIIADVRNRDQMEQIFRTYSPQIVFHAAAHKHVPFMEAHPEEAFSNNVCATLVLAQLSQKYGIGRFILLSTDKAVNPWSIMGATKRLAEQVVLCAAPHSGTRFVTVRFGNVLDSRGSVVPTFRKQIEMGGPLTVTHPDMARFFMTIPEAVQLVIQAAAIGSGGEVFVLDMGHPVKILDLARNMIRLSGFDPDRDMRIEFTGLRPGEKLKEELFSDSEEAVPTEVPKLLRIEGQGAPPDLAARLSGFLDGNPSRNREGIVAFLQELVPEYRPSHGRGEDGKGGEGICL